MDLLREPVIRFVIVALTSLVITVVLFKIIKSSAKIGGEVTVNGQRSNKSKRRGRQTRNAQSKKFEQSKFSTTGGVAGFMLIFFLSCYMFLPVFKESIKPPRLEPINIPDGFKAYSDRDFALAIPNELEDPQYKRNVDFRGFQIGIAENIPAHRIAEVQQELLNEEMWKKMFGIIMPALKVTGSPQSAPHQGHKGFIIPFEMMVDDEGNPVTTGSKLIARAIFDENNNRMFLMMYEDNEQSRQIISTFNLPTKER